MKKLIFILALISSTGLYAEQKNGIVYVKSGATGTGSSWSDAMGDIQAAINAARTDNQNRKDVWIAGGNYDIQVTLLMSDSVNVYGSFEGTETQLSERARVTGGKPWEFVHPSVLIAGDTCRLVETSQNFDVETVLDGFVLTNGKGRGKQLNNSGGAAVVRGNMALQHCIIKNSVSTGNGGGINMTGGSIRKCWIYNNYSKTGTGGGGGIYINPSSPATVTVEDTQLNNNLSGVRGGGINIQGSGMTYCTNLRIFNNRAMAAGVIKPGGGIYTNSGNNVIKNCLIYNNTGTNAVYYNGGNLLNNTIVKNTGGLYLAGSTINAVNNIIWSCATDSTGTNATSITGATSAFFTVQNNATYNPVSTTNNWVTADNIQFSSNLSNGIIENPAPGTVGSGPRFNYVTRFIGAASSDGQLLQLDSADWSIPMTSPCVNTGKIVATVTSDFSGVIRPQGYTTESALHDIGAYELPYYSVVAGEAATANGAIFSALGVLLTENHQQNYAKGEVIELFFQPNSGYKIERAYYTASNDNGLTFTGQQTDITSEISNDGFWMGKVNKSFKISVDWKSLTALNGLNADNVRYVVRENGVELSGQILNERVSVYQFNGVKLYESVLQSDRIFIPLSKGVYVLRIANEAGKLIIQ